MSQIKVGVATGDDVQKIFKLAKEKKFALPQLMSSAQVQLMVF